MNSTSDSTTQTIHSELGVGIMYSDKHGVVIIEEGGKFEKQCCLIDVEYMAENYVALLPRFLVLA